MRVYAPQLRSRYDDATLLRHLQAGDERAFETIFERHQAPLLSYCRHMLSDRDEGEDALQQTFVKAHRALLGGTTPRELRPWLYAIARNCCLTAIAARRPTAPLEEQTPSLRGLSEEVSRREDLRELVAGIGRLPEDQRSALLLAELDDLPHGAIATIVGCEVSKVKALVHQARSSLLADRDARNTPCLEIREQLSVARGGELRRGPLRRHLRLCEGCHDFQLALSAQRQSLAAVLPVAPSAGLAATILAHGASAHTAVAAAGIGHASGVGAAGGGTGLGSGAAGAGAGASVGVGAGAGGGTGTGALLGGGLVTKLAVGGAIVVLAAAGSATVHSREAHASPHGALRVQLAATETEAGGHRATEIAYPSGALAPGSPTSALAATNRAGQAGPTSLASLAEPAGIGSSDPLLTGTSAPAPGGAPTAGSPAAPAAGDPGAAGAQGKGPVRSAPAAARAQHRAALRRRQALLRRKAQLRRKKAELRHKQALLRRERAEARRARRAALKQRRPRTVKPPAPAPTPAPVVAPAPAHTHRHKADPAPESTPAQSSTPTETTTGTGSKSKKAGDTGTTTSGEETTAGAPTETACEKRSRRTQKQKQPNRTKKSGQKPGSRRSQTPGKKPKTKQHNRPTSRANRKSQA